MSPMTSARLLGLTLLFLLTITAHAQFGNAHVHWDNAHPTVLTNEAPTVDYTAPADGRHNSLSSHSIMQLSEILTGLNTECTSCETLGHYVSKIRAACLALPPKALKSQLSARGVKCEGCTMREHYLDRVLDTIHLKRL